MKTNIKTRRGFTLVELLVVIVIIASLAGLTAPMVIRQRKKADQTQAVNNARQIGLAMFEFETEYGSFPDDTTADEVLNDAGYTLGGESSNDYFRQLFAADITQSEDMFYAKTGSSKKPDGNITVEGALANGEVGFGYMMDTGGVGLSTAGNPARVTVVAPLASDGAKFTPDPYDKKAVVLRIDNSVISVPIDSAGDAIITSGSASNRKTLLETGDDTIWGDSIDPQIVAPSGKGK